MHQYARIAPDELEGDEIIRLHLIVRACVFRYKQPIHSYSMNLCGCVCDNTSRRTLLTTRHGPHAVQVVRRMPPGE